MCGWCKAKIKIHQVMKEYGLEDDGLYDVLAYWNCVDRTTCSIVARQVGITNYSLVTSQEDSSITSSSITTSIDDISDDGIEQLRKEHDDFLKKFIAGDKLNKIDIVVAQQEEDEDSCVWCETVKKKVDLVDDVIDGYTYRYCKRDKCEFLNFHSAMI